jgi:8-oxo-dGTP pyrophosphatase MutT (NUDIX family)
MTRVFGTILHNNYTRVLLVLGRSSGKWSFPKGHAYDSENPIECARRETYEETGITVFPNEKNMVNLSKGSYFLYSINLEVNVQPIDKNEISKTRWILIHDIPKYPCNVDVNNFYRIYKDRLPVRLKLNPSENNLYH